MKSREPNALPADATRDSDDIFLPFQKSCGRPGCSHVFQYAGTNPFDGLGALVKAHGSHCVGRKFGATGRCNTRWEPSRPLVNEWEDPYGTPALSSSSYALQYVVPDDDSIPWAASGTSLRRREVKQTEDEPTADATKQAAPKSKKRPATAVEGTENNGSEPELPSQKSKARKESSRSRAADDAVDLNSSDLPADAAYATEPSSSRSKTSNKRSRASPVAEVADEIDAGESATSKCRPAKRRKLAPASTPSARSESAEASEASGERIKKSCKWETERRAALEADPWTSAVRPTEVECRGCGRVIHLDKRSRYYPGLWEKHRERCTGVTSAQEKEENEVKEADCTDGGRSILDREGEKAKTRRTVRKSYCEDSDASD